MSAQADSLKSIYFALGANFAIAIAKTAGAVFTGSASMLAEANTPSPTAATRRC